MTSPSQPERRWTLYLCPKHGALRRAETHLAFDAPVGGPIACTHCSVEEAENGSSDEQLVEEVTVVPASTLEKEKAEREAVEADARTAWSTANREAERADTAEKKLEQAATAMERGGVGDGAFSSAHDCALYLRALANEPNREES